LLPSAREGAYTSWREPGWSVSSLHSFALEILGGDYLLFNGFCIFDGTLLWGRRGGEMDYEGHDLTLALHGRFFWFSLRFGIWQHCELGVGIFVFVFFLAFFGLF
jgi:hypothetical protein